MTTSDARQQLIAHIKEDAVFHGDFTLTSGKKATYYVDLRRVSLDHRVAPLIGQVMLDLIADVPDVAAVGGLTMGADPSPPRSCTRAPRSAAATTRSSSARSPRTTAAAARSRART
ncbi:Orotate phosphoribosyltransferase [Clavibacter michiganensis subsp. michiganensis]|uniref:Orotate phosphoribosyltransferase n=1 Tax=Clavibacter michiganensis subsp. michiganensis TaxID=33013 RepID=A0A251XNN1_CLAMM|nr:Orotate phosphoribosyltransferase [Clavibacter michiganensis subsp. michiganensis]OUE05112.1 Orotate phosphoribosyltransferase [Clavibacter michiganensis subsp. michiganensis]